MIASSLVRYQTARTGARIRSRAVCECWRRAYGNMRASGVGVGGRSVQRKYAQASPLVRLLAPRSLLAPCSSLLASCSSLFAFAPAHRFSLFAPAPRFSLPLLAHPPTQTSCVTFVRHTQTCPHHGQAALQRKLHFARLADVRQLGPSRPAPEHGAQHDLIARGIADDFAIVTGA